MIKGGSERQHPVSLNPSPGPITAATKIRANDLLRHREFEAMLDERLIDRIFISPTLWHGSVTLPEADKATRYRLVIAEYEEYLADDATPYNASVSRKDRRLVFIEHVALD